MVIADRHGLPIAAGIASASPHEVTLAEATLDQIVLDHAPERLIGDRAYTTATPSMSDFERNAASR